MSGVIQWRKYLDVLRTWYQGRPYTFTGKHRDELIRIRDKIKTTYPGTSVKLKYIQKVLESNSEWNDWRRELLHERMLTVKGLRPKKPKPVAQFEVMKQVETSKEGESSTTTLDDNLVEYGPAPAPLPPPASIRYNTYSFPFGYLPLDKHVDYLEQWYAGRPHPPTKKGLKQGEIVQILGAMRKEYPGWCVDLQTIKEAFETKQEWAGWWKEILVEKKAKMVARRALRYSDQKPGDDDRLNETELLVEEKPKKKRGKIPQTHGPKRPVYDLTPKRLIRQMQGL